MRVMIILLLGLLGATSALAQPSSNQARVSLEASNNNVVKIIQAGVVVTYNLTKDQEAHKLLSYLKSMPSISKQLDQLEQGIKQIGQVEKNQNKLLLDIARNTSKEGFISIMTYNQGLEKYILENNQLKAELSRLKALNKDAEFATVLTQAEEELKQLNHQAYQQLLEEFKLKRKKKLQKEKQQIAQVAYLQAQDSYNQFQYDKALLQVEEAIEYDRKNPNYLLLKGGIHGNLFHLQEALDTYLSIDTTVMHDTLRGTLFRGIGVVYHDKYKYDKALEYYEKALAIRLQVMGPLHPDVAQSYNNIGVVYHDKREYDKAMEYYNNALSIRLLNPGEQHPDIATSYNNIGLVYADKQEYDEALEFYHKSLSIRLQVQGDQHPDVAISYNNMGNVYYYKQDYDKAMEFYNKDLSINLLILGAQHPDVATSYNNIGLVYADKQEYDKAMEYFNKALSIYSEVLVVQHPHIAMSYYNLGNVYSGKQEYDKALEYYNKALAIRLEDPGELHFDTQATIKRIKEINLMKNQKK